jgi:hypothetical protein
MDNMKALCHILHSVSHWPVLVYFINNMKAMCLGAAAAAAVAMTAAGKYGAAQQ